MGFFKKLLKATIDVTALPVEMVKDVITLGNTGNPETYTGARAKKIGKSMEEAYDSLDDD